MSALLLALTFWLISVYGNEENKADSKMFRKFPQIKLVGPGNQRTGVYIGCYEDEADRMMKGKTKKFTDSTNSPEVCRKFCRPDEGEKYKYYALQNGNECYCADVLHRVEEKPDNDCDKECKGDSSEKCGGPWRNRVYRWINLKQNSGSEEEETEHPIVIVKNIVECASQCLLLDDCFFFNVERRSDGSVSCQVSTQKCARLSAEPSTDTYVAKQLLKGREDIEEIISLVQGGDETYDLGCFSEWVRGAAGSKCHDVCGARSKVCVAEQQSELDTNEKVAIAFRQANYECKSFGVDGRSYEGTPLSTTRDSDDCFRIVEGTESVCDGNQFAHHHPLCRCVISLQ